MLLHQAALSFKIWTGREAPLAVMGRAFDLATRGRIALVGFSGTGKTSSGRLLASILGFEFKDLDDQVEKESGMDIPAIFEKEGENGFRQREKQALRGVLSGSPDLERKGLVLACGGGSVLDEDNLDTLRERCLVVLLVANPETLRERLSMQSRKEGGRRARPLLGGERLENLESLLRAREPTYNKATHLDLDTTGLDPAGTARAIARELGI